MPILYEVVELANGDVALQREGDDKGQPLISMRFSTELLRFLRNGKLDIAKIMIEAGLEEVAKLAAEFNEPDRKIPEEGKTAKSAGPTTANEKSPAPIERRASASEKIKKMMDRTRRTRERLSDSSHVKTKNQCVDRVEEAEELLEAEAISHLVH